MDAEIERLRAELLAAAPELLEACRRFVEAVPPEVVDLHPTIAMAIARARAAIAKAEVSARLKQSERDQAVAAERERCARLIENECGKLEIKVSTIAAAIRRGDK